MSALQKRITGVILAGGLARRMGGQDKGLIELAGRPMIEYVLEALSPQVDELLINANRSTKHYLRYGHPVIGDAVENYSGPLAGIAAGLEQATNDLVLTVPCDGPWLPHDLGERLYSRLIGEQADICIAHDGVQTQPVFGLFHRKTLPMIVDYLKSGDRKLRLWLDSQNVAMEDFSDNPQCFTNVNTPEERERVEQLLAGA